MKPQDTLGFFFISIYVMIVLMNQLVFGVVLAVLGLMMGSFAGATMWRLRARQLVEDRAAGEKVDKKEYDKLVPLTKRTFTTDRSQCLHCGHALRWFDLIPLFSWASTRGRCRYCHKKIGRFEPLIEIGTALLFVGSFIFWPYTLTSMFDAAHFLLWLVACVMLVILFVYDLRWYILPNRVVFPLIFVSALIAILSLLQAHDFGGDLLSLCLAIGILSGLYLVLWVASKGAWIGFGDVKLGLALALLLGQWQLAFIALFAANLLGCLIVLPAMFSGKISRKTRVSFGPLLIIGAIIALLWGDTIIQWYFATFA
jgi:leader peptidase (prepilin peptidase) / N-methyltransferase